MSTPATAPQLRPMALADLDRVIGLASSLPSAPQWPRAAYEAAIDQHSTPQRVALVATASQSDEVAGFVVASLVPPRAELESIAVAVDSQRRGLGRQLLSGLVAELRQRGIEELVLEVRASNSAATAFYKSMGFHFTGLRPRYYVDPIENAVMMALAIK